MYAEELPADATTLIYLAKADAFDLAPACRMVLIAAPGVWREAVADGEAAGYPDAAVIRGAEETGSVRRVELDPSRAQTASLLASQHRLGQGESETLALAAPGGRVLVDDGRAAKVAEALGLEPISTLFLPVLAARLRRTTMPDAMKHLRALAIAANARAGAVIELERLIEREGAT